MVANLEELRRVGDPAPRHVRDVQQPVDSAEVDERTVLGEVLDDALDHLSLFELVEGLLFQLGPLLLQQDPAGQHDVAALLVELDDLEPMGLADECVQVAHRPQIHLRPGQESLHAAPDCDRQATLHPRADSPVNQFVALAGCGDLIPDLESIRLLLGDDAETMGVFATVQEDIDLVANLYRDGAVGPEELMRGDGAFRLVPNVDDNVFRANADDLSLDDVALFDLIALEGFLEECRKALLQG